MFQVITFTEDTALYNEWDNANDYCLDEIAHEASLANNTDQY